MVSVEAIHQNQFTEEICSIIAKEKVQFIASKSEMEKVDGQSLLPAENCCFQNGQFSRYNALFVIIQVTQV